MNKKEIPLSFSVGKEQLFGILHRPARVSARGVLVVVGGPQYRAGSHRQFVLLARSLAEHGIPVMRFDCRGMGDSEGEMRTFESIHDDIHAAINIFFEKTPELSEVVIWGLCDAASAASFYAHNDARVTGLVLLNPWVRTESGIAKAYLKHYYLSRLFDGNLWRKIIAGDFNLGASLQSLLGMLASMFVTKQQEVKQTAISPQGDSATTQPIPERMFQGLRSYDGRLMFVLSDDDFTADEFRDVVKASKPWRKLLEESRVVQHELVAANHTFSRREWRDQVAVWTLEWLRSW